MSTEGGDDIDPFRQALPASPPPATPVETEERPTDEAPQPTAGDATLAIPNVTVPGRGGRPTLRDLKPQDVEEIRVVDAVKTSEGAASSYIAYVITSSRGTVRHRYSEFESLRACLVGLYPVLIVPPIPDKQSLGDYASHPGSVSRTKEDPVTIARRRRMLAVFLNRLIRHPVLGRERVLWRFLSEDVAWSEVLHQAPLSDLPKNPLRAASHDPANTTLQALYAHMPLPGSSSSPLQEPDRRFMDSEAFTQKFSAHLSGSLEKINRRLAKRWSEYAADQAELGGVLNGFALVEGGGPGDGSLKTQETAEAASAAIEKVGQAVDATYVATNALLQDWERTFTEQLHEYAQFSGVIKNLLRYRHMKHIQWEMTRDTLETKRVVLEDLERHESEAQRLEQALDRVRRPADATDAAAPAAAASDHVIGASGPSILPQQKRATSFGFLGALRHSLNGMTDVDPEVSRRSSIGKNKDHIGHLQEGLQLATADLRYCSQTIQADLDRFQRQKVADLREMCLAFATFHIDAARKNLEQWQHAKEVIVKIPLAEENYVHA